MHDLLISPTAIGLYTLIGLVLVVANIRDCLQPEKPVKPLYQRIRSAKRKAADRGNDTDSDNS